MFGYIDLKQMQEVLEHVLNSDFSDFNGFHVVNRMNGDKFGKKIMVGRSFEKRRGLKTNGTFDFCEQVMMSYICDGAGIHQKEREKYLSGALDIREKYPAWPALQRFLQDLQGVMLPAQASRFHFEDLASVVKELNEHYGRWQEWEGEHVYGLHSCFK